MYHLLKGPILRLSVSFDDHSHLIGRKGVSHKNLQAFSKTLIHFPERSARSETIETCVPLSFQREDEVLITPIELELKKEPCAPEMDDRLLEVFSSAVQSIRTNQLLIFTVPFQCSPALFSAVQQEIQKILDFARKKAVGIYLSYPGLSEEHHREVVIRGTVSNSKLIVSLTNQVRECLSNRFKLPVSKLTSTTRIPNTKWKNVVAKLSDDISKNFGINGEGQIPASCVLDMYFKSIETDVKFDGKSLVAISAHDPHHILEVKTRLVDALPMNILIASNTVACSSLDTETFGILEAFYPVRIGSNFGHSVGDSSTTFFGASARRFFVGQKMALESNEGTVASMLEVKWLLSQPNLPFFLTTWCKMRSLWNKSYPTMDYPACLQSPKKFIKMEHHTNLVIRAASPTPAIPINNFSAMEVRPPRIGRYGTSGLRLASHNIPAAAAAGPTMHRNTDHSERHQPRSLQAAFEPLRVPIAPASSAAASSMHELRPVPAVAMMLESRAPDALMFEPVASSAPMPIMATAARIFEPIAAAAPIPMPEPRAAAAPMLEPVSAAAAVVAQITELTVATNSINEPRSAPRPEFLHEFTPWVSSNEDLAWHWQQLHVNPMSAERSRDASSSDMFGSSPESSAWNRRTPGPTEPANSTPLRANTVYSSKNSPK